MKNYIAQPLNGSMICTSSPAPLQCVTSKFNTYGEFEIIESQVGNAALTGVHDYLAITGPNSLIGVVRSYDTVHNLLRCFSNAGQPCTAPPNSSIVPQAVASVSQFNVVPLQNELAAEIGGAPSGPIAGETSVNDGQYGSFGVQNMSTSTCAQSDAGATPAYAAAVYVQGVQFGGTIGTQDAVVIDEYEKGPTVAQNHMERYFYVAGYGRVREGSATYDTATGIYDIYQNNANRNTLVATNTIPIPATQCPQGTDVPF